MKRAPAAALALAALLTPALAAACPQCASTQNGGMLRTFVLGAFVLLPWAIVALVIRFVRSGERNDRPVRNHGLRPG